MKYILTGSRFGDEAFGITCADIEDAVAEGREWIDELHATAEGTARAGRKYLDRKRGWVEAGLTEEKDVMDEARAALNKFARTGDAAGANGLDGWLMIGAICWSI